MNRNLRRHGFPAIRRPQTFSCRCTTPGNFEPVKVETSKIWCGGWNRASFHLKRASVQWTSVSRDSRFNLSRRTAIRHRTWARRGHSSRRQRRRPWPDTVRIPFQAALQDILNTPSQVASSAGAIEIPLLLRRFMGAGRHAARELNELPLPPG